MTLADALYGRLPLSVFAAAKTAANLHTHFLGNRSSAECFRAGHTHAVAPYPGVIIDLPDLHRYAELIRWMSLSRPVRRETRGFLRLAKDSCRFLDVGANAGFFSALYIKTRRRDAHVISVEADPAVFEVLKQTRERNATSDTTWHVINLGIFDRWAMMPFLPHESGYEARIVEDKEVSVDARYVQCTPMQKLCHDRNFAPDLIKIDIESFEFEAIMGSKSLLKDLRPRLHLELHVSQLFERDRDPDEILSFLCELGYRDITTGRPPRSARQLKLADGVSRLSLSPATTRRHQSAVERGR